MAKDVWYRIDKGNGSVTEVLPQRVRDCAADAYANPKHAIASGRFSSAFAIYSAEECLTPAERAEIRVTQ